MVSLKIKPINLLLWLIQILLAALFLMTGGMKLVAPIEEVKENIAWAADFPALIRLIGLLEVLGALALFVPALLRKFEILIPIAAVGLLIIMLLAAGFHYSRAENDFIVLNLILGTMALFVAGMRFKELRAAKK